MNRQSMREESGYKAVTAGRGRKFNEGSILMQTDLWQRRLGWICLVAIILFSGPRARSIFAAADDDHSNARPVPMPNTEDLHNWEDWQRRAVRPAPPVDPQLQQALDQQLGKYWLGVECRVAQPELKAQLDLKDGEGLVVVHVADDGPAAKAGLKRHDVIVSAGDDKLKRLSDLIKAVNAAEGKAVSLKIIRAGKEQTISVTPAERPRDDSQIIARPGPGFMWPGGGPPADLPDNVSVSIVRKGKEPAKITVTRGEDKWEISDQELNKLPDDLRPQVQRMLGAGSMPFPIPGGFNMPGVRIEGMPMGGPPGFNPPPRDGNPPSRGGDNNPPPRDRNPPPRDEDRGPPPPASPDGPGGFRPPMMRPGQIPPELMDRLERLDRRLEMLQEEMRRLQDGGPGSMPQMRPRGPGNGPDSPPPRDDQRDAPPGMRGGPPPNDRDRRGPPPDNGDGHGPSSRPLGEPPPNNQ
jgi:hypothetical protein